MNETSALDRSIPPIVSRYSNATESPTAPALNASWLPSAPSGDQEMLSKEYCNSVIGKVPEQLLHPACPIVPSFPDADGSATIG